jgi:hypothetical protein
MKVVRVCVIALLVLSVGTAASAGDLKESIAKAAAAAPQETPKGSTNTLVLAGTSLFVAGMAVGLYGFINNKNGDFSEFGEAKSSNKPLGAVGLGAAFAGGALMFLGKHRARQAPSVTIGAGGVSVAKTLSW